MGMTCKCINYFYKTSTSSALDNAVQALEDLQYHTFIHAKVEEFLHLLKQVFLMPSFTLWECVITKNPDFLRPSQIKSPRHLVILKH